MIESQKEADQPLDFDNKPIEGGPWTKISPTFNRAFQYAVLGGEVAMNARVAGSNEMFVFKGAGSVTNLGALKAHAYTPSIPYPINVPPDPLEHNSLIQPQSSSPTASPSSSKLR